MAKKIWDYETISNRLKQDKRNITLITRDVPNCNVKIRFKCDICEHKWDTSWNSVKSGTGCQLCVGNAKLTLQNVKEKLSIINDKIEIKSQEYKNATSKLECECKICGHIWGVSWNTLSKNIGCPSCAVKFRADNLRFDIGKIETFIKNKYPNIILHEKEYINARKPLLCECGDCGLMWTPTYDRLKAGNGCPKCSDANHIAVFNMTSAEVNKNEWINIQSTLYVSEFYNEDETFYKIGITIRSISDRFKLIPYNYKNVTTFDFNLYDSILIEKIVHSEFESNSYKPNKKFGGHTECFSKVDIERINEIINDYKKE